MILLLAAFPFFALHHYLNWRIGGTFMPANAQAAYFIWPGSPFDASNLTGGWAHDRSSTLSATPSICLSGNADFSGTISRSISRWPARSCSAANASRRRRRSLGAWSFDRRLARLRRLLEQSFRAGRVDPLVCAVARARVFPARSSAARSAALSGGLVNPERVWIPHRGFDVVERTLDATHGAGLLVHPNRRAARRGFTTSFPGGNRK